MVWFYCDTCCDTIKKPKLPHHFARCSGQTFTCVDCSQTFDRETVKAHSTCVTEHEKYALCVTKPTGQAVAQPRPGGSKGSEEAQEPTGLQFLTTRFPWRCTLCNVTCTSQDTLTSHATGQKHKRKVRAATGGATGGTSSGATAEAPGSVPGPEVGSNLVAPSGATEAADQSHEPVAEVGEQAATKKDPPEGKKKGKKRKGQGALDEDGAGGHVDGSGQLMGGSTPVQQEDDKRKEKKTKKEKKKDKPDLKETNDQEAEEKLLAAEGSGQMNAKTSKKKKQPADGTEKQPQVDPNQAMTNGCGAGAEDEGKKPPSERQSAEPDSLATGQEQQKKKKKKGQKNQVQAVAKVKEAQADVQDGEVEPSKSSAVGAAVGDVALDPFLRLIAKKLKKKGKVKVKKLEAILGDQCSRDLQKALLKELERQGVGKVESTCVVAM